MYILPGLPLWFLGWLFSGIGWSLALLIALAVYGALRRPDLADPAGIFIIFVIGAPFLLAGTYLLGPVCKLNARTRVLSVWHYYRIRRVSIDAPAAIQVADGGWVRLSLPGGIYSPRFFTHQVNLVFDTPGTSREFLFYGRNYPHTLRCARVIARFLGVRVVDTTQKGKSADVSGPREGTAEA